jgi:hypothetical protein
MYGTIGWIVLLGVGALLELLSRLKVIGTPSLVRTGAFIAVRWAPRVLLILFWIFVGVHLFTRYTIPSQ